MHRSLPPAEAAPQQHTGRSNSGDAADAAAAEASHLAAQHVALLAQLASLRAPQQAAPGDAERQQQIQEALARCWQVSGISEGVSTPQSMRHRICSTPSQQIRCLDQTCHIQHDLLLLRRAWRQQLQRAWQGTPRGRRSSRRSTRWLRLQPLRRRCRRLWLRKSSNEQKWDRRNCARCGSAVCALQIGAVCKVHLPVRISVHCTAKPE